METKMENFFAIDVETANSDKESICSIGVIHFIGGKAASYRSTLINPQCAFNFYNTKVHGITDDMVENAPTWDEFYPILTEFIGSNILVAHNASFDRDAINKMSIRYNLPILNNTWICTLKSAKRALDIKKWNLPFVVSHLGYEVLKHHDAHNDALSCGLIASAIGDQVFDNLGTHLKDLTKNKSTSKSYSNIDMSKEYHDLTDHNIVFTGDMLAFSRDKAKEFIISLGGKSPASLSKKTSILVTGPGAGPMKLQKALELDISTMSEQEFINLITKSENNN